MIGKRCSVALDLAGDRDFGGLLGTDPLHEPGAPGFQGRPALGSVQQDAGGLEQVGPQQPVAPFGTDDVNDGAGQAHRGIGADYMPGEKTVHEAPVAPLSTEHTKRGAGRSMKVALDCGIVMEILVNIQMSLASDFRELVELHLLCKNISVNCGGKLLSSTGANTERRVFLFCPDDQAHLFERNITKAIRPRGFNVEIGYAPVMVIEI